MSIKDKQAGRLPKNLLQGYDLSLKTIQHTAP